MTSEIQQNRYDQLLRRVAGIIGPGSKVKEVITELFPMFDVENVPAELYLLMGTQLGFGGGVITALAGQSPKAQLFNPPESGKLVTITSLLMSGQSNDTYRWGRQNLSIGTAIATENMRDTRIDIATRPVAQIRQLAELALAPATGQVRNLNTRPLQITDQNGLMVLSPGHGMTVGLTIQATTLNYTFYWRERTAEQSELNF